MNRHLLISCEDIATVKHKFIDWEDKNAYAAAEAALGYMKNANYDWHGAIDEAARRYSTSKQSIVQWIKTGL